jgi:hypothetical protein
MGLTKGQVRAEVRCNSTRTGPEPDFGNIRLRYPCTSPASPAYLKITRASISASPAPQRLACSDRPKSPISAVAFASQVSARSNSSAQNTAVHVASCPARMNVGISVARQQTRARVGTGFTQARRRPVRGVLR